MRLAAALLAVIYAYRACAHEDELVPAVLACMVACGVLAVIALQLRAERADAGARKPNAPWLTTLVRVPRVGPANDNGQQERSAS